MSQNLMDTVGAASFLGLSPSTLAKKRVHGDGPKFVYLGGKSGSVRYRLEDLNAWLVEASSTSESVAA